MSEAVEILIKADDKASEKFATVAANADKAGAKAGNAFKEMGGRAKATTEFVGTLANMTGNSQIGALASMLAQATEKASAFSEVSKAGGAGALAFKLGLVGLAATAGGIVGKAIGDMIWQTAKFERGMANAKEAAKDLDAQVKKLQGTMFANQQGDIELIRDPEAKRAAYKQLLADLNRDIQTTSEVVGKGRREVEAWAAAWKITGNRKQFEQDAIAQLAIDKERLATLKEQRDEIIKAAGARAEANDRIRAENAAAEEVEREALRAKAEALKEEENLRDRLAEKALKAAEDQRQAAEREAQRIDDLIGAEEDRLELQRIELELGKEAAKVQALVNEGVDEATAKRLAAEETAIEALRKKADEEGKPKKDAEKKVSAATDLQASQSRLLTRGSTSQGLDKTNQILQGVQNAQNQMVANAERQLEAQKAIAANTANTLTVRPTT